MTASLFLASTLALTQVTSYEYDELGRVIAERSGAAGKLVTRYGYDPNGRITSITNSQGETTRFSYDGLGRVATTADPTGAITRFTFDAEDRIVSVVDPRDLQTTYAYNGFGDLVRLTSPDTGTTTHTYRADGMRQRTVRNDGSALEYRYDTAGRMTEVDGGAEQRKFIYDTCGAGHLCEATILRGGAVQASTRFTRTADGRVLSRIDDSGGAQDLTRFAYDDVGRLSGIVYPSGRSVAYHYAYGRLTGMTATRNGTTQTLVSDVRYRPFGDVETWIYGNGLQRRYNVDDNARLFGISTVDTADGKVVQSLTYGFDGADRISAITNAVGEPKGQTFDYDSAGRVIKDTIAGPDGGTRSIAHDANGNRNAYVWGGSTERHAIDPRSNRTTSIDGTVQPRRHHDYTYDLRGNRTGDSTSGVVTTLRYDAFDHLSHIERSAGVAVCEPYGTCRHLPAGATHYIVNALDQRVAKSGTHGTTRFVHGGPAQLLAEHGEAGWKDYLWFGGELVGMFTPSDATIVAWYQDYPIVVGHPGLKFVHNDHLGRPEVVTSGNKVPLWRAKNHAFDRNVSLDLVGGLNLGFPGQYYDAEGDFWQNGFRVVDLKGSTYLQSDPLGLLAGINTYTYVGGNPVSLIDPLGLEAPASFNNGGVRMIWEDGAGRAPDYLNLSVTWFGWSVNRTLSRSGAMYVGGGLGTRSLKNPLVPSVSLSAGWLNCPNPGPDQVDEHLRGFGQSVAGGFYGVGGLVNHSPGNGTSTMLGVGFGFQLGAGQLNTADGRLGSGW